MTYNVVANPIPKSGLFVTLSFEELTARFESMSAEDKAFAYKVMMMTCNACNKLVEDEILSKDIFAC